MGRGHVLKLADRAGQGACYCAREGKPGADNHSRKQSPISVSLVCLLWSALGWTKHLSLCCLRSCGALERSCWPFFTHLANHSQPSRQTWSGQWRSLSGRGSSSQFCWVKITLKHQWAVLSVNIITPKSVKQATKRRHISLNYGGSVSSGLLGLLFPFTSFDNVFCGWSSSFSSAMVTLAGHVN